MSPWTVRRSAAHCPTR